MTFRPTRLAAAIAAAVAFAAAAVSSASASASAAPAAGSEDDLAAIYYRALELNTPQAESTWDETAGHYSASNFAFVNVFGNAVLLKFGTYDEQVAGTPADTLRDHTLRSITHFAATDRWVDPAGEWGQRIYFDSTMETYFVAAAELMWDDLDEQTRANVDTIIRSAANYIVQLGPDRDPYSGGWTTNGLDGGYRSDSKIEEMGARTMPLATALAWLPDDPSAPAWREWLDRWSLNMSGLPPADLANPTPVDGTPISGWAHAQNIWDTFLVENHGSYAPVYQQSIGAYPGRNTTQLLLAGQPLPPVLTMLSNADRLWFTMGQTGTDAGVAEDFMVADRHHLYGRNLLPITYRAVVGADPYAARAERMLADHLIPYVEFPPAGRLTKFSGQPSYEPEARAETAMAYLLHYWRDHVGGGAQPVSTDDYFAHFSTAVDYGAGPGLVAQQTPRSLAGAVTKPGFVKFAFLPQHDDWLFDVSGSTASFLPSTTMAVSRRNAHVYRTARDGFDGTATAVTTATGVAGFTTLPDGSVVYATSGTGDDEGGISLNNLDMPGVPGLTGSRTFTGAGGSFTLASDSTDTVEVPGTWLNVDGRAGFVVRGSQNPITATAQRFVLSTGAPTGSAGMVVEGRPAESPDATAAAAARPAPASDDPALRGSLAGGQLSLFNLGLTSISGGHLTLPQDPSAMTLFLGPQQTTDTGTTYLADLPAADACVAPAMFTLTGRDGGHVPAGLTADVVDSHTVKVTGAAGGAPAQVAVRSLGTGETAELTLTAGETRTAVFRQGPLFPVTDLARTATTFPTSPLPDGMTDPEAAVDGSDATAWQPGPDGRMVVDLGSVSAVRLLRLQWTSGLVPGVTVETSADGVGYSAVTTTSAGGDLVQTVDLSGSVRYVAVRVNGWHEGEADLADLAVLP